MPDVSTKPYLIRAIYDWCTDTGFTPYLAVSVDASVRVPKEFVRDGEIVLNVSMLATSRLNLGNDAIEFQARFGGVARDIYVPVERVMAIYARENGQGMAFEVGGVQAATAQPEALKPVEGKLPVEVAPGEAPAETAALTSPPMPPRERPKLTRIK